MLFSFFLERYLSNGPWRNDAIKLHAPAQQGVRHLSTTHLVQLGHLGHLGHLRVLGVGPSAHIIFLFK